MLSWLHRLRPLTAAQKELLAALLAGCTLKSHRYLDGRKVYRLHALDGEAIDVADGPVEGLVRRGLLQSNQKFPAATLLLSERGRAHAARLRDDDPPPPLTSRRFE